ncbi:PaaI family thioesterase [Paraconexibacter sp.]|uniref:PaaI family thioesterase n=1 Tax=Paraconexibacter sp. TaxID=2949640 RepID=UPI003563C6AA
MPLSPDALRTAVQTVLDVPLHRALDLQLLDPSDPVQGLAITVGDLTANNVGVLHGGLAPLFLDVSAYLAVLPTLEPGTNAVTHTTTASLLRSVASGTRVRFRGTVDKRGRGLVFCSAHGLDEDDRLVATAQIVKSIVEVR